MFQRHVTRGVTSTDTDQLAFKTKDYPHSPLTGFLAAPYLDGHSFNSDFSSRLLYYGQKTPWELHRFFCRKPVTSRQRRNIISISAVKKILALMFQRHGASGVTSTDTNWLAFKTKDYPQSPFSAFFSTIFGRTLMHFRFFVQIAILRAEDTIGPAWILLPQAGNIAQEQGHLDEVSSWKVLHLMFQRHGPRGVASTCTDRLALKTKSHAQSPCSGFGRTLFGWTLLHFSFFV
ncbi:hypothetical protein MRX96_046496 [Rhipicephalus microplus]